ncbi:hypothetical protein KXD93_22340 [Mucilaginibacter sp. BJC16-A38]|uniref:hypothetical protein n=1 Tax=Mucilaginibacter phenanthrenivorans TaxID=1234842 RepID=UPI0021580B94|nr:hypothetical protein [Mucilaginibacter phenanthrenivorans]MCR8560410.1 hypothetical protein [Mucilaginibacter phenanthrenivorans]
MENEELQQNELNDLVGKIKDHIANSSTLSGMKLSTLGLATFGQGTHTCCSDAGDDQIMLPDSVPCPFGYHDC